MYPEHRAGLGADTTTPPQVAPSSGIGWGSLFVGVLVGDGVPADRVV